LSINSNQYDPLLYQ